MKVRVVLLSLICLFWPVLLLAGDNPWDKKLPFKKATIEYQLSGMQKGTETLCVKDYGEVTARHTNTKTTLMGMAMVTEEMELTTPDWVYSYNITEGSGEKYTNPKKFMIEEYEKLSGAEKKQVKKNAEEMGVSMMEGFNGEIEKNATEILGFQCDKVSLMGSTVYTIHDTEIPLKTDVNMMGMKMSIVATSFDKGKADGQCFEPPAGIEATYDEESDQAARSIAVQTMAMLKDPDAAQKAQKMPSQQQNLSPEEQQEMEQAMEMLKNMFGGQQQ